MPFDWKTPFGYFVAFLYASVSLYYILFSVLPTVCLTIGSYWMIVLIIKDIINDYRIFNNKLTEENNKEALALFSNVIQDMADAKQLSDSERASLFSTIFSTIIFNYLCFYGIMFPYRLISEFADIHELTITNMFLWAIFTMTSMSLAVQLQIVE